MSTGLDVVHSFCCFQMIEVRLEAFYAIPGTSFPHWMVVGKGNVEEVSYFPGEFENIFEVPSLPSRNPLPVSELEVDRLCQ